MSVRHLAGDYIVIIGLLILILWSGRRKDPGIEFRSYMAPTKLRHK